MAAGAGPGSNGGKGSPEIADGGGGPGSNAGKGSSFSGSSINGSEE